MYKKGWYLFLLLLIVAGLLSCGKSKNTTKDKGELVSTVSLKEKEAA